MQEDRRDVQKVVEEMQSPADGRPQAVMLRRMQLAQADPLFSFGLAGSVRAALHLACQRHSQQQVLEVSACDTEAPNVVMCSGKMQPQGWRNTCRLPQGTGVASACLAALTEPCAWPASVTQQQVLEVGIMKGGRLLQSCL